MWVIECINTDGSLCFLALTTVKLHTAPSFIQNYQNMSVLLDVLAVILKDMLMLYV